MKPAVPVDRDALASKAADVGPAASARRERGGEKEGVGSDGLTAKGLELESRWVGRTRDTYLFMCFLRKGSRPLIPMLAVPDRALPKNPRQDKAGERGSSHPQHHRDAPRLILVHSSHKSLVALLTSLLLGCWRSLRFSRLPALSPNSPFARGAE